MSKMRSQAISLFHKTHKIAVRLRLVFMLIAIVTAISGITAILQAKTIMRAHTDLNEFALPMLTVAQSTERNLSAMFLVLENINSYQDVTKVIDARYEIRDKTENVRQNLFALREFDASNQSLRDLEERLNIAEISSFRVLDEQIALFALQDDIADTLDHLSALQKKSHQLLDDFAFTYAGKMESLIRYSDAEGGYKSENLLDQFDTLFVASLNLSAINFGLNDVIELTRSQAQTDNHARSSRVRLQINAKLNDIINRLTYLPESAGRRDLAGHIATLRDIVAKDAGIFARLQTRQKFQKEFQENRATHLELIPEISNISTALMGRTLLKVRTTSKQLSSAVYQLVWIIMLAFLAVLMTVALTNHIVIDLQFSRRIRALNEAVTAIAEGKLDHPISVTGSDELGDVARALAVFKDNAEDLRRSNVELEKFAYVAAHDLRSSLHAIHDLSTWALEDEESGLSSQAHAYLTLLQQRVERLKRLLNDLLVYARAGENEPDAESVELNKLVQELAQLADPRGNFQFQYFGFEGDLFAQLTPLQQIVGNLLNNAVKHHDRPQGEISITANVEEHTLVLVVEDDGPGIEQRYLERVFELFQTLRPRDEVEGSGMGLAIVKKLVTRRKGKIVVTSNPAVQRGTSFKITLPLSVAKTNALGHSIAIAA